MSRNMLRQHGKAQNRLDAPSRASDITPLRRIQLTVAWRDLFLSSDTGIFIRITAMKYRNLIMGAPAREHITWCAAYLRKSAIPSFWFHGWAEGQEPSAPFLIPTARNSMFWKHSWTAQAESSFTHGKVLNHRLIIITSHVPSQCLPLTKISWWKVPWMSRLQVPIRTCFIRQENWEEKFCSWLATMKDGKRRMPFFRWTILNQFRLSPLLRKQHWTTEKSEFW